MEDVDYLFYKKVLKPRIKEGIMIAWCPEADKLISEGENLDEEIKRRKRKSKAS